MVTVEENFDLAYEKIVSHIGAAHGKLYKAFNELETGLRAHFLSAWWHERTDPDFGETRASRAFGAALTLAMIVVTADRRHQRAMASAPPDGVWVQDPEWDQKILEIRKQHGLTGPVPQAFKKSPLQAMVGQEPMLGDDELRWHVSVAHMNRTPTWEEFAEAVHELRPGVNFCVAIPPRSLWLNYDERVLHAWEVRDQPMIDSWRVSARGDTPT